MRISCFKGAALRLDAATPVSGKRIAIGATVVVVTCALLGGCALTKSVDATDEQKKAQAEALGRLRTHIPG